MWLGIFTRQISKQLAKNIERVRLREREKILTRLASGFVFLLTKPEFYSRLASWRVVIRTPLSYLCTYFVCATLWGGGGSFSLSTACYDWDGGRFVQLLSFKSMTSCNPIRTTHWEWMPHSVTISFFIFFFIFVFQKQYVVSVLANVLTVYSYKKKATKQ
jgi:hypothetical protein